MRLIKMIRDYGNYRTGQQIRVEDKKGSMLVAGAYAEYIGGEEKMQVPPENKMDTGAKEGSFTKHFGRKKKSKGEESE